MEERQREWVVLSMEECASGREAQWCCPVLSAPTMHRTGRAAPAFRMDLGTQQPEKRVYYVHLPTHLTIMTTS